MDKKIGKLARGCELCAKGEKLVLFITGICPRNCKYCPLSEEKKNNDVMHANEVKTHKTKEVLKEIELSAAKGAGITGGDPLAKLSRTLKLIKAMKKKFDKKFHIHLYTSTTLLTKSAIDELKKSGLDELRVHVDIFDEKDAEKLPKIKGIFKETGIEIPTFPNEEKRIIKMILATKDKVDFYNLNQLEYATLYEDYYKQMKWKVEEDYSVKESDKTALRVINYFKNSKLRIHYCSSEFKDQVQFTERIKLRARTVAKKYDEITKEGMLFRGAINADKKELNKIKKQLEKHKIPCEIDKQKSRVLFPAKLANQVAKQFKRVSVVEEYPTREHLEVYEEFLS